MESIDFAGLLVWLVIFLLQTVLWASALSIIGGITWITWKSVGIWGVPLAVLVSSLIMSAAFCSAWFGVVLVVGCSLAGLAYAAIFLQQLFKGDANL